jgi:methionine-rich copper-binding protein CopC
MSLGWVTAGSSAALRYVSIVPDDPGHPAAGRIAGMAFRRLIVTLAVSLLAVLAAATPAFAHAELTASTPAKDASLATAPKQLQLTFSEPVSPISIKVTGPSGTEWKLGEIRVQGNDVTAAWQAVGPAGPYAITYTVKSDDGDDVTGTVPFTMTAASPASTTTAPTPGGQAAPAGDGGGGVPAWVWIVIVLAVLIAAGGLVGLRTRRRTESPAER